MGAELDKKLREIVADKPYPEQAIADIKQAFTEAGYIPYKPYLDIPEKQRKEAEWWSKTPTIMTGQEFYARFMAQLKVHPMMEGQYDVRAIAKKAAGIE